MPAKHEVEPLLPTSNPPSTPTPTLSAASRSKLAARRYLPPTTSNTNTNSTTAPLSEKSKGKQRALPDLISPHDDENADVEDEDSKGEEASTSAAVKRGRAVTIIFSNEDSGGGNLEVWVEEGESVGSVKDQIRHLRPKLQALSLRLIHSGRLLTDGILLLPWLRALEERVRRQAAGMSEEVEEVLKDVGLGEEEGDKGAKARGGGGAGGEKVEKVWLHCNVGGAVVVKESPKEGDEIEGDVEPAAPRRRGFDVLLDAGLSSADVMQMRRQFYESRGEEVPEGMDAGDVNDEHARALEEQWIEGDLTHETATTTSEGMFTSILHGLLTGFLFPIQPWFYFRELPLPNFFDAEAEAAGETVVSSSESGDAVQGVIFGTRMQMGILLGTLLNVAFGALKFLN